MYVINSKRFKKKILPEIPKGCAFATKIHPRWNKNNTYYGTNNFKLDFRPSGCLARITIFESSEYWNYSYLGSEFDIWLRGTWNNANAQTLWNSNLWFFKWVGSGGGVTTSFATKNCAYSIRACKTYEGEDVPDGTIFSNAYTDGDGNNYNAVKIGTQLWITENLKTTKFQDGTPITLGTSVSDFQYNDTTPLYTFYEYNTKGTTYKDAYGGLYNWYCVNNNIVSGDSWNVCSGNDLNTLKEYLINTKWRDEVITTNNIGRYVRSCRQVDHPLDIYFKTTWNIPSSGYSFTYPVASYEDGNYNYSIDWGDNTEVEDYYDDTPPTHIYEKAGNYTIKVSGSLPRFAIANGSMKSLLLGVENWGDVGFKSMAYMFQGVTNNIEIPNTLTGHKDVTSMEGMFFSATTFNGDISNWDVSNITNMKYMFRNSSFNQDIGSWNVSKVTNMDAMFYGTPFNQDIGNWNVSAVTNMSSMFMYSYEFNQDIGDWNVSKVIGMSYMFYSATTFNQDIGNWNVSAVTNMSYMFRYATNFNQNIGNWNVGNVTNMVYMFANIKFNKDIGNWNVSKVTNMSNMFYNASNFNQDIGNWNVSNVTNMAQTFRLAQSFNQDIGNWNVSAVTNMSSMFRNSSFNQYIGDWDVSNVTNMDYMFYSATNFNQDLSGWCVENITREPRDFYNGSIWHPSLQPQWGEPC